MTITGGVALTQGANGFLTGGNSINTLSCDGTSWMRKVGSRSSTGSNTCPSDGPAGIKSERGIQGPQGLPGGIAGLEVVSKVVNATIREANGRCEPAERSKRATGLGTPGLQHREQTSDRADNPRPAVGVRSMKLRARPTRWRYMALPRSRSRSMTAAASAT